MNGIIDTTVAWLTFRQLFVRRRLIAAAFFSVVPAVIAIFYRVGHESGLEGAQFLAELYRDVVVGTLLPLAAVVLGTAAFGGEIDDGTIMYLLVKPLPRWRIVLTKYVVTVASTAAIMIPAILLPWLVVGVSTVSGALPWAYAAAIGFGIMLYGALFLMLGLTTRRGLLAGLLYIVVIELVMSHLVDGIKSLSVRELIVTVVGTLASGKPGIAPGTVTLATAWTMGSIIVVVSIGLAIRWLQRYEMAERL